MQRLPGHPGSLDSSPLFSPLLDAACLVHQLAVVEGAGDDGKIIILTDIGAGIQAASAREDEGVIEHILRSDGKLV